MRNCHNYGLSHVFIKNPSDGKVICYYCKKESFFRSLFSIGIKSVDQIKSMEKHILGPLYKYKK